MLTTVELNAVWIILAAALVLFMEGGFAALEGGLVQTRNAVNVTMKVFANLTLGGLVFYVLGVHLMFGKDIAHFLGWTGVVSPAGVPTDAFILFQIVCAIALASIISGFVAERMRFSSYLIIVLLALGVIYPISSHWAWGTGGWLQNLGYEDFAGSGAIHALGGFMGLALALLLGARKGKYNRDGSANLLKPSNLPLAAAGAIILWFGWFGFNAGSALATSSNLTGIVLNTFLGGAAGGVTAMLYSMLTTKKADPGALLNGPLAGLVAVTAGCAYVSALSAIIIGLISGVLVMWGLVWADKMHADDPVGAFAVHGVNGVWGVVAVGLFDAKQGLFTQGAVHLLGVQVLGAVVFMAWGFCTAYLIGWVLKKLFGIRVSAAEEKSGLDVSLHGLPAYTEITEGVSNAAD